MPQVKCPSCATIVTHAAGYDPICPNCGFRGPAPSRPGAPAAYATPLFSSPPDTQLSAQQAPQNGLAIGALVCGITGFLVGITAPIAVILGIIALNQRVDGSGRGMAIAGIVLGALVTIGYLLFFMFIVALFN